MEILTRQSSNSGTDHSDLRPTVCRDNHGGLKNINRTDLSQRFTKPCSELKGKIKKNKITSHPININISFCCWDLRCTLWMNIDLHSPREHKLQQ
ncbi:hypothetical protein F7725_018212 [Dissostichus mawsoni]|uniref:Uncharacterized protein n=1 Tax=Dissostichus mawsoni TaxID=36200 RepID=A0A7J5XQU3_DISMA|nr:hypothetical protein F7725_018212 [Dissostichus mawsoni]